MVQRRKYRSSGALVSQLFKRDTTLGVGTLIADGFSDFSHRSSRMVLKKLDASLGCGSTQSSQNLQRARFAIIAKPIPDGNPVSADWDNEKYNKWQRQCYAYRDDTNNQYQGDFIHLDEVLKIVIDIGFNLFFAVLNEGLNTVAVAYALRLFVKYI